MKFRLLVFFVLVQWTHAHSQGLCSQYLTKTNTETKPNAIFETTKDRLMSLQIEFYYQQNALINQIRLELLANSLPREGGWVRSTPTFVSSETLALLAQWSDSSNGSNQSNQGPSHDTIHDSSNYPIHDSSHASIHDSIHDSSHASIHDSIHDSSYDSIRNSIEAQILKEQILSDPYLKLLANRWEDPYFEDAQMMAPDFTEVKDLDYLNQKEGSGSQLIQAQKRIIAYLDTHLTKSGPMKLTPWLVILRIIRDHDISVPFETRQKIADVFIIQKILYFLNQDLNDLIDFRFGTEKSWSRFSSYRDVLRRFHILKSEIRQKFSWASTRLEFERLALNDDWMLSVTYEDDLIYYFLQQNSVVEKDLIDEYIQLKHMLRLMTEDDLREVTYQDSLTVQFGF